MKVWIPAILATIFFAGPAAAQAQYDFQIIEHPGAIWTQTFSINARGDISGTGAPGGLPFVYDSKTETITDIAPLAGFTFTAVRSINDAGTMTGRAGIAAENREVGIIRDKNGNFTTFWHPDAVAFTRGMDINNKELVTGTRGRLAPFGLTIRAFVYDPKEDSFTDLIPTAFWTTSHGINSRGDIVGDSKFFGAANDPCGDNPGVAEYSWVRTKDGIVTYFNVNGLATRARGISDDGKITGFVYSAGPTRGFIVELGGTQCQDVVVADNEFLQFGDFDIQPYEVTNSGKVVGLATEDVPQDPGFIVRGFIATPK